jgi:hypothetical protein
LGSSESQSKDTGAQGMSSVIKSSLLTAFQRVIKMATTFAGVLFEDKQHNLDKKTMDEIQEENTVKLILLEVHFS